MLALEEATKTKRRQLINHSIAVGKYHIRTELA